MNAPVHARRRNALGLVAIPCAAFVLATFVALASGCRNDPQVRAHLDMAAAEYRGLEDRVYELEYELDIARAEVERLKGKGDTKPSGSGRFGSPSGPPSAAPGVRSRSLRPDRPQADLPELEPPVIDSGLPSRSAPNPPSNSAPRSSSSSAPPPLDFEPEIEFGEPTKNPPVPATAPAPSASPSMSPAFSPAPPLRTPTSSDAPALPPLRPAASSSAPRPAGGSLKFPPPRLTPSDETSSLPSVAPTSDVVLQAADRPTAAGSGERVTQIYVNPFLTVGADFDGQSGDDGLTVVLEPRNASNEFVPQAGNISLVVLDPARQGESARVARWDFDVIQASRFIKNNAFGSGIQLQVNWPGKPPENSRLRLFVRYETVDHRKLQAEHDLYVSLPGQLAQRWTPKSRRTASIRSNAESNEWNATPGFAAPPVAPFAAQLPPQFVQDPQSGPGPLSPDAAPSLDLRTPVAPEQTAVQPRPAWSPQR